MLAMGVAAAAIGFGPAAVAPQQSAGQVKVDPFEPRRRSGKGKDIRRGKGKIDRPAKRKNMRTLSKRVRAKHRKAARRG